MLRIAVPVIACLLCWGWAQPGAAHTAIASLATTMWMQPPSSSNDEHKRRVGLTYLELLALKVAYEQELSQQITGAKMPVKATLQLNEWHTEVWPPTAAP